MKNSSFSSYIFLGLTAVSMCCYVYLHAVAYSTTGHCPSASTSSVSIELDGKTSQILLPDVALVKHFFSIAKLMVNNK